LHFVYDVSMRFCAPVLFIVSLLVVGCSDGDQQRITDSENQLKEKQIAEIEANEIFSEIALNLKEFRQRNSQMPSTVEDLEKLSKSYERINWIIENYPATTIGLQLITSDQIVGWDIQHLKLFDLAFKDPGQASIMICYWLVQSSHQSAWGMGDTANEHAALAILTACYLQTGIEVTRSLFKRFYSTVFLEDADVEGETEYFLELFSSIEKGRNEFLENGFAEPQSVAGKESLFEFAIALNENFSSITGNQQTVGQRQSEALEYILPQVSKFLSTAVKRLRGEDDWGRASGISQAVAALILLDASKEELYRTFLVLRPALGGPQRLSSFEELLVFYVPNPPKG
jgi:hypothetical protein